MGLHSMVVGRFQRNLERLQDQSRCNFSSIPSDVRSIWHNFWTISQAETFPIKQVLVLQSPFVGISLLKPMITWSTHRFCMQALNGIDFDIDVPGCTLKAEWEAQSSHARREQNFMASTCAKTRVQ